MKYKSILVIFLALFFQQNKLFASESFPLQLSFMTGNISTSFSESEPTIKATDDSTSTVKTPPYSGSSAAMPMEVTVEYFGTIKRSYFFKAGGPFIMGATPDKLFYGTTGINFYFRELGSSVKVASDKIQIQFVPKFRYYLGLQAGVAYLVYNTISQTKNDIIVEFGGQAGGIYTLNPKWGLKGEFGFAKGTGALVATTTMKLLLGATYNINL